MDPSSLVVKASAIAAVVVVVGGGAGSSNRPAASLTMASTTTVMTAITVARGVAGASTATGPGMAAASWSSSASSTRAGSQVTDACCPRPSAARAVRRVGTTAPAVTRRTASNATRPSHSTLGPT